MRPLDFQIILDDPMGVFSAGSEVSGRVLVRLSETLKMTRLTVQMTGEGEVMWTDQKNQGVGREEDEWEEVPDHFTSKETYLKLETTLCDRPELHAGTHLFPFSFHLPPTLPSSFDAPHGSVGYTVRADIVQAWYRTNYLAEQPVRVQGVLELSSSSQVAGRTSGHRSLGALFWKAGPIAATLTTERTGFLPGDTVVVTAELGNQSTRTVSGCVLSLVQQVTYCTSRKNRTETRVVAEVKRDGLAPGSMEVWDQATLEVPLHLAATDLTGGCGVLRVEYRLELRLLPGGLSLDLVVSLPLTIGTVLPGHRTSNSGLEKECSGVVKPSAPSPLSNSPPSYMDAFVGQKEEEDDDNDFQLI